MRKYVFRGGTFYYTLTRVIKESQRAKAVHCPKCERWQERYVVQNEARAHSGNNPKSGAVTPATPMEQDQELACGGSRECPRGYLPGQRSGRPAHALHWRKRPRLPTSTQKATSNELPANPSQIARWAGNPASRGIAGQCQVGQHQSRGCEGPNVPQSFDIIEA